MRIDSYKCPCCSAPLVFSGASHLLECGSCGNAFEADALDVLHQEESQSSSVLIDLPSAGYTEAELSRLQSYACGFCGAELITEENTSATECAYCGSPAILPTQLTGATRPAYIIPFAIEKEQALAMFHAYFKGKRLIPKLFTDSKNRAAEIRRLYAPYWLFYCDVDASISYDAKQTSVTKEGDVEVTRTRRYWVGRRGRLTFDGIPIDGSKKLDDRITESLEPFNLRDAVGFSPSMLAGALADAADVEADACRKRVIERLERSTARAFRETVEGYDEVSVRHAGISVEDGKAVPVLLPIWLITTKKTENGEKKTYTFAVNGQTGKFTCDIPYSKTKARKWFLGLACALSAGGYALSILLAMLGVLK